MEYSKKLNKFFDNEEDLLKAEKEYYDKLAKINKGGEQAGGVGFGPALLAIIFVLSLIFAPIFIVLGMFGKFVLNGIYKEALHIKAFKIFRIIYAIISLVWLGLCIAAIVVLAIQQNDALELVLFSLVGGNILLFILSIVIGNIIYKKHKDDTFSKGVTQEKNR